jgi:putative ABC transport system permease protein
MFALALRSSMANKRRLVGTALSVLLGVAFLSGTLVFTDTIGSTFDRLFASIYDDVDTFVRSDSTVETEMGGEQRGRLPESVVATVAAVDGVADAQGYVGGFAQIIGADGDAIGNPGQGAPTLGMSYAAGDLDLWQLTDGSVAPGPGEVVIDQGSADRGDLTVGDRITVLTQTGPHEFALVGIATFGSVDSPGGASTAIWDLATAQEVLLGGVQEIDAVLVDAADGVTEEELTARVADVLPPGSEAITGSAMVEETQDAMREGLSFFNTFLLVFAGVALVVASFTIYNTFQIIVTQRSREMALLRSVGATRAQVLQSQLLEAVIIGLLASAFGLVAGVAVAGALKAVMEAVGIDIPAGGTVFQARTAVIAMVVGLVVTVGSAVVPSIRGSRVPPMAALRSVATERPRIQAGRRGVEGGVLVVGGVGAFVAGLAGAGIQWVGLGALLTFIGAFVLGPVVARPTASVLGAPVARAAGVTGLMATQNAVRNPIRTARTGGALMVGVALVAAITVIAASAKDWTHDVFGAQFTGDFVVSSDSVGFGGLSPDLAVQLGELPEVDAAAGIRVGSARDVAGDGTITYVSVDPASASEVFDIGLVDSSFTDLGPDGVLVEDGEAARRGLAVGDQLELGFVNGTVGVATVVGLYTDDDLAGSFVVNHALHEQSGADQFDFSIYIVTADGVSADDAQVAIASVSDDYANADLQSREEYIDTQAAQVDQLVNLMYGLLALAVLIALFSIANSMSLSIHERTRELGLLRAVGMTRHQVSSAVRWEAAIVATLGAGLGITLGVFFGWAISVTLREGGLAEFALPVIALAVITAIGVVGGVLASVRPAWRAAHLDVLRAISSH